MAGPVRDFKMKAGGGWAVENGDFAVVAGAEAVGQGIEIRTSVILGEVYLNNSLGVNYLDVILVKNPDPLEVRAEIARAILDTPDVTEAVGAEVILDNEAGVPA